MPEAFSKANGWLRCLFVAAAVVVLGGGTAYFLSVDQGAGVVTMASPAAAINSDSPSLATAPDGTVWLSWLETDSNEETSLKFSTFDPRRRRWSAAGTVTHQRDWTVNVFDAPQLVVQRNGLITAEWSTIVSDQVREVETPRAFLSQSADGGRTWSKPELLTTESDNVEYVSLAPLADGGMLAVWIDGRERESEATPARLYARRIGSKQPDTLLDASVCDCCRSSLTALPDGGALLAYRSRTPGEIRDILNVRYHDGIWSQPRISVQDNWKIDGCPVNGPRVVGGESGVAQVWFTGAGNEARVLASRSTDAGAPFAPAERIDLGHPVGRVDTLLLRDGSQVVTWMEGPASTPGNPVAGLYLRRSFKAGLVTESVLVTPLRNDAVGRIFPRIALVKDFDDAPAQLMVTFTRPGKSTHVETQLLTLPSGKTLSSF